MDAGFFHLHVHFGEHQHDDEDHQGNGPPGGDSPRGGRHCGVLTLSIGVAPAPPPVLTAIRDEPEIGRRVPDGGTPAVRSDLVGSPWSPRAPPA
jgi:hypothetical protein